MKPFRKNPADKTKSRRKLAFGLILLFAGGIFLLLRYSPLAKIPLTISFKDPELLIPLVKDDVLNMQNILTQYGFEPQKITRIPEGFRITFKDDLTVIFSYDNPEKQAASLQLILNRFKIEGRKVSSVDLRYSKPVVK